METKANYTIVGIFTVVVFAAAFAFVYWIARTGGADSAAPLDVVIEGSVTGLDTGSPVLFNGINVGQVRSLRFSPDNPRIVIARAQVRRDLPITASTKAVLGITGLTGIAHIEFEGGALTEQTVFEIAEAQGAVAVVKADPSAVNNLISTAQDIFSRTDSVLTELEGFVADARGPLTQTLTNTTKITDAIAQNTEKVEDFMVAMGSLGETLEGVSGGLNEVLEGVGGLVDAVKPEDVEGIVADIKVFTNNLNSISANLDGVGVSVAKLATDFEQTGPRINQALDQVGKLVDAVDPAKVGQAVDGLAGAGDAIAKAATDVSGFTETLGDSKDDVEAIVANARQMAERLNAASVRVDGVLAKVDGFLGDSSADALITDVSDTLASFRQVANTLNSRLDGITSGLERFSDRGLRDVETLVSETRRSISRIESAITALEDNPQRLLFGGDGDVKRFDGRQRR